MLSLPSDLQVCEVGPRDGFQSQSQILPTHKKVEIIESLIKAGFDLIQVTSFVHPKSVPQLADAEDLLAALPKLPQVNYNVLSLNKKGVERALASKADQIEVSVSASNEHGKKNTGMPREKARAEAQEMARMCLDEDRWVRASIQCAFGCFLQGEISEQLIKDMVGEIFQSGVWDIVLADTPGLAHPLSISRLVSALFQDFPHIRLGLHLHDTRGLGLANALTALQLGVNNLDTSLGGMGGCPFLPNAAGNIPSEDTLYLCDKMGIQTGLDIHTLLETTQKLEVLLDKTLPAKIKKNTMEKDLCS